jgi:hypothetical protein
MQGGGEVKDGGCMAVLDEGAEISVAGDDGGVVMWHRGREEEVRCIANRIHGAWRSGSPRRGGFDGVVREGKGAGEEIGEKGIERRFFLSLVGRERRRGVGYGGECYAEEGKEGEARTTRSRAVGDERGEGGARSARDRGRE